MENSSDYMKTQLFGGGDYSSESVHTKENARNDTQMLSDLHAQSIIQYASSSQEYHDQNIDAYHHIGMRKNDSLSANLSEDGNESHENVTQPFINEKKSEEKGNHNGVLSLLQKGNSSLPTLESLTMHQHVPYFESHHEPGTLQESAIFDKPCNTAESCINNYNNTTVFCGLSNGSHHQDSHCVKNLLNEDILQSSMAYQHSNRGDSEGCNIVSEQDNSISNHHSCDCDSDDVDNDAGTTLARVLDEESIGKILSLNKCKICCVEFKFRADLLSHMRTAHEGEGEEEAKHRAIKCLFCAKVCKSEVRLLNHESLHLNKSEAIKCAHCGEIFENCTLLRNHKQQGSDQISCSMCHKKLPSGVCETFHMKNYHNIREEAGNIDSRSEEMLKSDKNRTNGGNSPPSSKHRKMRCRFCPKKCSHKKNLLKHELSHPDGTAAIRCNLCLEILENYKVLKSHKKQQDSQVMCSICSSWFPNEKCLSNHTRNSHSSFDGLDEDVADNIDDVNQNDHQYDDDYSSEGSSVYLDSLPRYTISDSIEPLRITIKQEKEEIAPYSPRSSSPLSSVTPPTPPTPSPQGPPTPSPPPFPTYFEESVDEDGGDSSGADESYYAPRNKTSSAAGVSRRKSTRAPRKVLSTSVYFESSSEESDHDDSADFLYTPKLPSSWKAPVAADDESDDDPDWRKTRNSVSSIKKRVTRGRGRGKKRPVEDFPRLVQPKVKRLRARGCGGQKAQDAATALAMAVEDMEFSMPELKVVIRPLKRSLGGSITKASVKRYTQALESDKDYLVDDKPGEIEGEEPAAEPEVKHEDDKQANRSNSAAADNVYEFQDEDDSVGKEEGEVVIKKEPRDANEDDTSMCSETHAVNTSGDPCHASDTSDSSLRFNPLSEEDMKKEIRYICKLCGRELQYRSHLLRHLRRVHGGEGVDEVMRRLMKCRFCSKQYSNELSLIHHEKLHDGTNKIKCNKCEEVFDDKNALRRHQRKTHWEHQPVECDICKKQLADNTCLKAHMKHMHTAEERKVTVFTCESCGRQLHTKTAFQNHVASKCGTNLLFPCETCGKSFSFKGSLKAHQLLHTGVKSFLCRFCGKAFHQKGEMKRHERKHTGEKPFVCNICGRAFAYRESLLGHSAVHTGIKPFPCKSCGMRFSCSGNLVKHRRSNNCRGSQEQSDTSSLTAGTAKVTTSAGPRVDFQMNTIPQTISNPLFMGGALNIQNDIVDANVDAVVNGTALAEKGPSLEEKSPLNTPVIITSSVIKTNPDMTMKSIPASVPLLREVKIEAYDEGNQCFGMNVATNRFVTEPNSIYETQESNVTLHSAYGTPVLSSGYNDNQYRPVTQNTVHERHFAQFAADARIGRNDPFFDREAIMRQEMTRQAMERSVDRQASRLLDCFGGVQFGGLDRRNTIQSLSAAAAMAHPATYSNFHASHFSNYTTAHSSSHSNSHAGIYGGNAMVPGQVSFAGFPGSSAVNMAQNNQVSALSSHPNNYAASHMSHLGAFLGHLGHAGVQPNNAFPRYALSHNMGSSSSTPYPGSHRM